MWNEDNKHPSRHGRTDAAIINAVNIGQPHNHIIINLRLNFNFTPIFKIANLHFVT